MGFADEAKRIRESFAKGDRAGVAAAVSDDLCDAMAIVGDADAVRGRIRAYAEQGVDVCVVNPIADPRSAAQLVETLAGSLDGLDLRQSGVVRATGGA
jgi:hypothetical protein